MGYGSLYLIINFGTLCGLLFVTPILWLSTCFLKLLNNSVFGWLEAYWNKRMFFNDWIGFLRETYLFLGMCVMLNIQYLNFDTYGNIINSLLAMGFGLILLVWPLFVGLFFRKFLQIHFTKVEDFLKRYGNGIEGLNFKRQG
jgi:hypothetical protein